MRTKWEWAGRYLLPLYVTLILIYLLVPLLLVIPMSITETRHLKFPPTGFTLHWYREFFNSPGWTGATYRSLLIAALTALVSTTIGVAASLALALGTGPWGKRLKWLFLGPQMVPVIALALGTLLLFSRLGLYGSIVGIVVAHSVLAIPFVITAVISALQQRGDTLSRAARVMGANPWQAFFHVTLPLIRPAMLAAAVFAFFVSFDELIVSLFVMGANETLPMRIWADVRQGLTPVVAAVATLLILATAALVLPAEMWRRRQASQDDVE